MKEIWTEKYRPRTVKDYVFRDETLKNQVLSWIENKSIGHLLISGNPGTGKTTLAKVLINDLEVEAVDVLFINASRERGIDVIRDRISNFSQSSPWGDFKIVLLDEADYLTPESQAALRGTMEQYAGNVRFILTCNHPNMIIPAVHSRSQAVHINSLDETDFAVRLAEILVAENIEFEISTLDTYIRATYPDLRKTINTIQLNVRNGKLAEPDGTEVSTEEWRLKMVALFQIGKIREARELICQNIKPTEYVEIFQFLYRNLDFFGKTDIERDEAVVIIRNGLVKHTQVADPEINLSATLIELARITSN